MGVDANPNVALINSIAAGKSAYDVYGILADGGFTASVDMVADLLNWVLDGDVKDNFEKACIVDFVIRHHGKNLMTLTWEMTKRYLGMSRTNRCGKCRRPGHTQPHCPF
ncbi:hypothetical protein HXX76_001400 [Chlamydomonas incerta]|uniref:CCHC-type domain-containing protein n=1 Tax=Chlamydomonas incerta TaxID=51695 RepID=A0A835WC32_CHLIN|nr:hypothetical protein HXX76_001400 [Chlamydomonas incerta]|eukprot:KAG2444656.1 hypothetical protein HXX76_001400 [Chlamydomonas incerta]